MPSLSSFSVGLMFISLLVEAGVQVATVWVRLESFRLFLRSPPFSWQNGTSPYDTKDPAAGG